jgi:flagellar hook-length control protein FliK
MKIPPANPLTARLTPETNRPFNRRGQTLTDAPRADDTAGEFEGSAAAERDFASVLDEVVSRPEQRKEESSEGDRRVSRENERAEQDGSARRREEREGGSNHAGGDGRGGFETRAGLREVSAVGETSSARAILHVADLERIVSAVRAQVADGGRQVVTIELRRSVLEGLKVTLSTDAGGRVTAEFIAASERVRSQLDARAGELAELLRGRGVNLGSLSTSVDSGGGAQGGEGGDARASHPRTAGVAHAATQGAPDTTSADEAEAVGDTANTYRA